MSRQCPGSPPTHGLILQHRCPGIRWKSNPRGFLESRGWDLTRRQTEWLVRDYGPSAIRDALSKDDYKLTLEYDIERSDYQNLRRCLELRRIKREERKAYESVKPHIDRWRASGQSCRQTGPNGFDSDRDGE